jgi:integrase
MAKRLVATRVATLPQGTYTDPGQTGLQLRVHTKRNGTSRTWLLRFKFRGEESRIALGHFPHMSLNEARELAGKFREGASQGIDPRRARPKRNPKATPLPLAAAVVGGSKHSIEFLVSEFAERYLKPNRKRPEYALRILQTDILPHWKGRDARTIEPHEVIELLDKIVDRGAPVMANRAAAILTQLFKFGVHRRIVNASPVQLLYRPGGKEKPRERSLTDDELKAFLRDPKAATRFERLAHAMTLLLLTGQRRGELAAAKWSEIDLKAKTWLVPPENSKTGRGHIVPLSEWAVTEFQALKKLAKRSAFVLPANGGSIPADAKLLTRGVARCQERMTELGIDAFTLHDLRRTCRTGLSRLKIQPHIAERVLNHAQEKIAGTYDVWEYADEKRAALDGWAAHLEGLVAANKSPKPSK